MPQRVVQKCNQISVGWLDARASPEVLFVSGRMSFRRIAPADCSYQRVNRMGLISILSVMERKFGVCATYNGEGACRVRTLLK